MRATTTTMTTKREEENEDGSKRRGHEAEQNHKKVTLFEKILHRMKGTFSFFSLGEETSPSDEGNIFHHFTR